jgi:hypothetical protein
VSAALALALLLGAPAPSPPQATPKAVTSRTSAGQARLGEPLDWEIEIRHGPSEAYALPNAIEVEGLRVVPVGCRRAAAGPETLTTCTVRLALFTLGPHDLPALRLEAQTPAGARVLDVPGPRLEGVGVIDPKAPSDKLELRDVAAPVPLLVRSWRLVLWAAGLLLAAVLAVLGWRWWRARSRRAAEPPAPLPPAERFARRLDWLESERLPEQGRAREFFFALSEAVREYLGAVTGVPALDLTTEELLGALEGVGDPRLDLAALRGFSEDVDLVKYARFPAGGHECQAALRFARDLLERLRPPPATSFPTPTSPATSTPPPTSVPSRPEGRP